ncbi:MAG: hypothetical protein D6726_06240 [Nitrospirae bacterium]|nr:MAG: hypothetical protein D6726_06240 [Nitrospirota bacterium]
MKRGSFFILIIIFILAVGVGIGMFYFYFIDQNTMEQRPLKTETSDAILRNYTYVRIFYPVGEDIEIIEKKVSSDLSRLEMADYLISEYLKVSASMDTGVIPEGTSVNDVYISRDNIVYIDFNSPFKKNFRGDVIDEYMLIKTIYDTIIGNIEDLSDVAILIDGKQTETLGGHFMISRPLKSIVGR